MIRNRAASAFAIVLGSLLLIAPASVASASQHEPAPDQAVNGSQSAGSNGAHSTASAAVADVQAGNWKQFCNLVLPVDRSGCIRATAANKAYPNIKLQRVTVTGDEAVAVVTCSGATYCSYFANADSALDIIRDLIKYNGRWDLNLENDNGIGSSSSSRPSSSSSPGKNAALVKDCVNYYSQSGYGPGDPNSACQCEVKYLLSATWTRDSGNPPFSRSKLATAFNDNADQGTFIDLSYAEGHCGVTDSFGNSGP